jgi:hypothetical protein
MFLPFAGATVLGGLVLLATGRGIGWWFVAAPVVAMGFMSLAIRPRFELTREGVVFRKSAQPSLLPWEEVEAFEMVKAGGRQVIAYRLRQGVTLSRRHPGAGFLRAKGLDFDGGYFADQMSLPGPELLATLQRYLADPAAQAQLPRARSG